MSVNIEAGIVTGQGCCGKSAASEDVYEKMEKSVSISHVSNSPFQCHPHAIELKKMCKEGAFWGTVAGVYVGMEYGLEKKNAMVGGALTGALASAISKDDKDKIVINAITGGAIATAAQFLNYLASPNSPLPSSGLRVVRVFSPFCLVRL